MSSALTTRIERCVTLVVCPGWDELRKGGLLAYSLRHRAFVNNVAPNARVATACWAPHLFADAVRGGFRHGLNGRRDDVARHRGPPRPPALYWSFSPRPIKII
jgi:hypothetical protein